MFHKTRKKRRGNRVSMVWWLHARSRGVATLLARANETSFVGCYWMKNSTNANSARTTDTVLPNAVERETSRIRETPLNFPLEKTAVRLIHLPSSNYPHSHRSGVQFSMWLDALIPSQDIYNGLTVGIHLHILFWAFKAYRPMSLVDQ